MKKRFSIIVISILLVLLSVVPALADGNITLTGHDLTVVPQAINFVGVNLDGTDQPNVAGTTTNWTVTDARGTGAGYTVNIKATDFVNVGGKTISVTGFEMTLPNTAITELAGNDKPVSAFTTATALTTEAQPMVTAAAETGMGSYTLLPTFTLDVPAETYAGAYTSVVTLETAAAPQ